MSEAHILVRCNHCKTEKQIPLAEATKLNDVPKCGTCEGPMVTVKAVADQHRHVTPLGIPVSGLGPGGVIDPVKDPDWKRRKMHGVQLSDEEAAEVRRRLGFPPRVQDDK